MIDTQQCRKVRWPELLGCGHYVTGGKKHRRGQHWICEPCALAARAAEADDQDPAA